MCPPGVDQTCRTDQRWSLLAPKRKEMLDIQFKSDMSSFNNPIDHLATKDFSFHAFEMLGVSVTRKTTSTCSLAPRTLGTLSPLEELPAELHLMIMKQCLLVKEDIVALGLCSRTLWTQVLSFVQVDLLKSPSIWSNTPLLCSGTYLTSLPPAIYAQFPDQVVAEDTWRESHRQYHASLPTNPPRGHRAPRWGQCPARRWNWGAREYFADVKDCHFRLRWPAALAETILRSSIPDHLSRALHQDLQNVLHGVEVPSDHDWVLRNLTIKEFVKLEVSFNDNRHASAHVLGLPALSLDKALMLRICWSDMDYFHTFLKADKIGKLGTWAGHRFDVCTAASHTEVADWKDVTGDFLDDAEWFGIDKVPMSDETVADGESDD